jgi:multiple sugar transport system substrate-binding protein
MLSTGYRMTRRQLLHMTGAVALATGVGARIIIPGRASAQQKTLKILQWKHFVPGYDKWFNEVYTKEWGEKNECVPPFTHLVTPPVAGLSLENPQRPRRGT